MPSYTSPDIEIRRRRLLGVGLRADLVSAADLTRDISLTSSDGGTDLATTAGTENLGQCLAIGLTTLRGSDVFNQRFGFLGLGALTEQTSPLLARESLRCAVAEFLSTDPRVRRIIDIQAGNPMAAPSGADRRVLDVKVNFEAVSGESAAISTGGLASGADWGVIDNG